MILDGCDIDIWLKSDKLQLLYYCNEEMFPNLYSSVCLYATQKDDEFTHFLLIDDSYNYKIISREEFFYLFDDVQNDFNKKLEFLIHSKIFADWDLKEGECEYAGCYKCPKLSECNDLYEEEVENQLASDEFWADYALCNPMDC